NAAELLGQRLLGIELSAAPAVLDSDVLPIDEAGVAQTPAERRRQMRGIVGTAGIELTDHRHRRLLRVRRERPSGSRAADKRDEFAPFHSITSSARASSVGGISRPSALAVLRLMTSSNLVGCCTGRSAGFSPLLMRSTS